MLFTHHDPNVLNRLDLAGVQFDVVAAVRVRRLDDTAQQIFAVLVVDCHMLVRMLDEWSVTYTTLATQRELMWAHVPLCCSDSAHRLLRSCSLRLSLVRLRDFAGTPCDEHSSWCALP